MNFKEKYARRKLKKLAARVMHQPVFPNIDEIKVIGVLWQPTQKDAYNYLKDYFNRDKIIFRGFCVFEENSNPHPDASSLTIKDLNFWGLPKPEMINDFVDFKFEILFSLSLKQNLVLDYIILSSKALFKVGCSANEENYFDLNINIGEKQDAMFLAKQQIFYLSQLNKKQTV